MNFPTLIVSIGALLSQIHPTTAVNTNAFKIMPYQDGKPLPKSPYLSSRGELEFVAKGGLGKKKGFIPSLVHADHSYEPEDEEDDKEDLEILTKGKFEKPDPNNLFVSFDRLVFQSFGIDGDGFLHWKSKSFSQSRSMVKDVVWCLESGEDGVFKVYGAKEECKDGWSRIQLKAI